jgi:hypothetical protein
MQEAVVWLEVDDMFYISGAISSILAIFVILSFKNLNIGMQKSETRESEKFDEMKGCQKFCFILKQALYIIKSESAILISFLTYFVIGMMGYAHSGPTNIGVIYTFKQIYGESVGADKAKIHMSFLQIIE